MIVLDDVWKSFGKNFTLQSINLKVQRGEIFGYLGPNGAGKTTTIRIIATLLRPDKGYVEVEGIPALEEPEKVREVIGVLPENVGLYENLTGEENLLFFAKVYNLSKKEARERIKEYLEFFGLRERKDDLVGKYSKGMKKRLALARAMLHSPKVLLLDEPTAGLSPEVALEVERLIMELARKEKVTIFLSTHNLDVAERLCSRVGVILHGRLVSIMNVNRSVSSEVVIRLADNAELFTKLLNEWSYELDGDKLIIRIRNYGAEVPRIISMLVREGARILEVYPKRETLRDMYMRIVRGG